MSYYPFNIMFDGYEAPSSMPFNNVHYVVCKDENFGILKYYVVAMGGDYFQMDTVKNSIPYDKFGRVITRKNDKFYTFNGKFEIKDLIEYFS